MAMLVRCPAAVVPMAKAKVSADYSTRITVKEVGRWIGLNQPRITRYADDLAGAADLAVPIGLLNRRREAFRLPAPARRSRR